MKKFCLSCEENTNIVVKPIEIKVGAQIFKTNAEVCEKCESYLRTPKMRKEMDEWGKAISESFSTEQPRFTETLCAFLDVERAKHGLDRSQLIRVMLAFYLQIAVKHKEFKTIRTLLANHDSAHTIRTGKKEKVNVRVRYVAFRQLDAYSTIWNVGHAKAIEDAAEFCVGLQAIHDPKVNQLLKDLSNQYVQFVETAALAA